MTKVVGFGASTLETPSSSQEPFPLMFMSRSKDHLKSAAVNGLPLANFTFGRRVKVYVSPSGETAHRVASNGRMVLRSSPSNVTSVLYVTWSMLFVWFSSVRPGSSVWMLSNVATVSVLLPADSANAGRLSRADSKPPPSMVSDAAAPFRKIGRAHV